MKKRLFAFALVLCLFLSLAVVANAEEPADDPAEILEMIAKWYMSGVKDFLTGYDVDGKSLTLYGSNKVVDSLVSDLAANPEEYRPTWDDFTAQLDVISENISEGAVDFDVDGAEVTVKYTSSTDSDLVYYITTNGTAVFNLADGEAEDTAEATDDINFYPGGMYKVGVDLEPGEYYFIPASSNHSLYIAAYSDSNGDDILENEGCAGPVYMTVESGQYLEVSNAKFCLASDYPSDITDIIISEGMYLVGKDIVPGEYRLTNTREYADAYYCIYPSSAVDKRITSNSLFETSCYVTVQDGQYLHIEGGTGSLVS